MHGNVERSPALPGGAFLATVTVPRELLALFQRHQRLLYHILFQAAAQAIITLAKDKRYFGADIGMMAVLHTWARHLDYHPHLHFLIPGGGVTPDGKRWKYARPDFSRPCQAVIDAKKGQFKTRCIPALHFIQMFLKHVLPKGFVKVRYFGFLATKKRETLDVIKELIGKRLDANEEKDKETEKVLRCPDCGGILVFIAELPKRRGPPLQEATL